jgi:hypothetical protein
MIRRRLTVNGPMADAEYTTVDDARHRNGRMPRPVLQDSEDETVMEM